MRGIFSLLLLTFIGFFVRADKVWAENIDASNQKAMYDSPSVGTLWYFPLQGRAGAIRMMLTHAGVKFDDVLIQPDEWPEHKPHMDGNKMPNWQDAGTDFRIS